MKTAALALCATLLVAGNAHGQNAEKSPAYEAFQFARTRNMFDPNRQARTESSRGQQPPPSRSRPNFIMLTGTMVTQGKALAFFSGGSADANKVASVGETVSGYKIAAITAEQVQLEKAGQTTPLAVGKQLPLEGTVIMPPALENAPQPGRSSAAPSASGDSATPGQSGSAPAASSPGGASDVLKKMMERRQQEMTK